MSEQQQDPARSFGGVADAYDRGRPTYPLKAAAWLTSDQPVTVLELGAGTGKLTRQLVELGHDVHATDPDPAMLALLERNLPEVRVSQAAAEEIPAGDRSYDVVVSAQAFHWFDLGRALPEIARVLKPRGRLALVWNERDERIPWVRRLGSIIGTQEQLTDPSAVLEESALFGEVERATYASRQVVDRHSIQDLVRSRSNVATLGEADRAAKLQQVLELYDEYGRGMDGMQLPYVVSCFRAAVLEQASFGVPAPDIPEDRSSDGSSTDMLLIDFH
jgi:ubiquinone/menaquinone biosynthesis C-methylase UbiE